MRYILLLTMILVSNAFAVPDFDETKAAAKQGNVYAQVDLGYMYANGEGVPENDAEAIKWFRKAADQGNAGAQNNLGYMYANGDGVPENDAEAVRWYRKAADQGDVDAQFNLGVKYDNGEGVPENDTEAMKWFRKAADQGDAGAQYNLGIAYAFGDGVPENDAEAVKWYRKAAVQGHTKAQFNLGVKYANGEGIPENNAEAVRWYRKAADQGDAGAQYNLGNMYANGEGIPENDAEAVRWYRKAADQGHALAQYNLGYMYATGAGVPENSIRTYVWWSMSKNQGNTDAAGNLDILKPIMTKQQIAEAQILARQCYESNYKDCDWYYEKTTSSPTVLTKQAANASDFYETKALTQQGETWAKLGIGSLITSAVVAGSYNRDSFLFESYKPNTSIGFYTNQTCDFINIDHVVSLKDAYDSGAASWSTYKKWTFANEKANHVPSCGRVNSSKGSLMIGLGIVALPAGIIASSLTEARNQEDNPADSEESNY